MVSFFIGPNSLTCITIPAGFDGAITSGPKALVGSAPTAGLSVIYYGGMIPSLVVALSLAIHSPAIEGEVVDKSGLPVVGAAVCILDGATGVPVDLETSKPFTDGDTGFEDAMGNLAFALTDEEGAFRFDDVAPGTYRLLAQSWVNAPAPSGLLEVNGAIVHVRGRSAVTVKAEQTTHISLTPLGDAELVLGDHAANDATLLLVSKRPPVGPTILGYPGWPGQFLGSLVAYNRMPDGVTTVRGLPDGDVHVSLFSADNNGGPAAASVKLSTATAMFAKLHFMASWSDGIHGPPPELADVVTHLSKVSREDRMNLFRQASEGMPEMRGMTALGMVEAMMKAAKRTVEYRDGKSATLLELSAALAHLSLMEHMEKRGMRPNPWKAAEVRPATLTERRRDTRRASE